MKTAIRALALVSPFALSACVSTQEKPVAPITIDSPSISYIIPNSDNLIRNNGHVEDIKLPAFRTGRSVEQNKLNFKKLKNNRILAHRRVDNGQAGSGIKYLVDYKIKKESDGYSVTFKPVQYTTYQEGLIGKFDIPNFTPSDLLESMKKASLDYRFELNSEFNADSITGNFSRLTRQKQRITAYKIDPISHEKIPFNYTISHRNKNIDLAIQVTPYKKGSKIVVYTSIEGSDTSENTVDFSILEKEVLSKIKEIVEA